LEKDPRLEAEGEVSIGRLALDQGELEHAAGHLANALSIDPGLPDALLALQELAGKAPDTHQLFPVDEARVFSGAMIAQAHLSRWADSPDDAVELLAATAAGLAKAGQPQPRWQAVRWLEEDDLPTRLDPDRFPAALVRLSLALPDPAPEQQRPPFAPFLRLAYGMVAAHADHPEVLFSASMLARRLGATADALAWSSRAEQLVPSLASATTLGFAHLHLDQIDQAIQAWQKAMARDPTNHELPVQLAWELAARGRLDDALTFVDRVLAVDPHDPRASAAAQAFRYHRDKDVQHLLLLAERARNSPADVDASQTLAGICRGIPWLGMVPEPSEAVINTLKRALAEWEPDSEIVSLTVSALEPPSAMLTLHRAFPRISPTIESTPAPDLRKPLREVTYQVWDYEGTVARPAVAPPSPSAGIITRLARCDWAHPLAAYEDAAGLADLSLDDLLGLLVQPPDPPDEEPWRTLRRTEPGQWLRSVQAWACLGIARHRDDEPWHGSTRRRVLTDLADGPEDWVTEAACNALVASAWADPTAPTDVAALIAERFLAAAEAQQTRAVTILDSLAWLVLACPAMPQEVAGLAKEIILGDLAQTAPEGPVPPDRRQRRRGRWLRRRRASS
jgi:tetratricopeptide (TPR) repeat protein